MDRQAVNSVIRAAVVALVVFIAFQFFFGKRETGNSLKEVKAVKEVEVKLPVPPSKELGKVVKVDTPLYRAEISTVNGKVVSLFVKQYGAQLISDVSKKFGIFPLMTVSDDKVLSAELSALELTPDKKLIEVKDAPQKLVLTGKLKDGRVFKKIFTFYPDSYRIDFSAELEGANLETLVGLDIKVNEARSSHMGHVGPVLETDREIVRLKPEEITPFLSFGKVIWAGEEDKYFLMAVKDSAFSVTVENLKGHTLVRNFVSNGVFYGGPKELNRLESLGMDAAIDFGIFGFLAKPMLKFFLFLHRFIPNWGVVIIVLTLIVKLLLHPLAHKSYVSMKKMQELAPKLEEIKKRYGKDPQKLQEE
ncbi:MAG: membrane protein insertase YidC, partial [Desulfurobacteriaceae bacterium]